MKHRIALALVAGGLLSLSGCGGYSLKNVNISIVAADPTKNISTINTCEARKYIAQVYGQTYTTDIVWEVDEKQGGDTTVGTIAMDGTYTAPCTVPSPASVRIGVAQNETASDGTTHLSLVASITVTIQGSGSGGGGGGNNAAPAVSITVNPTTINQGQDATLNWSSTNCPASGATINGNTTINGIAVGSQGQTQVSPSTTTSYVYSCTNANGSDSKTATLTVQSTGGGGGGGGNLSVSVTLASSTLTAGQTETVTAAVANDPTGGGVTWSAPVGSFVITDAFHAVYTAPSVTTNTNVTITATSVADQTVKANATLTVVPPATQGHPQVNVTPGLKDLPPNYPYKFACAVSGATVTNPGCVWTLQPALGVTDAGTIQASADGTTATYTSPNISSGIATVRIIATSEEFPLAYGSATVYTAPGNPVPPPQP